MKVYRKIDLNLASRPVQNRKLFYFLGVLLGIIFIFISVAGGNIYFKNRIKIKDIKTSIAKIEQTIKDVKGEEKTYINQIDGKIRDYKEKADLVNSLILRKTFSWTDLLSALEDCLPETSYIISLTPSLKGDSEMGVRFEVLSPGLEELLDLVSSLNSMNFKHIRVMSESRDDSGYLLSEISLTYERNI
ncbi:MAG: hypothetical protein U9Q97_03680 [Acidobacteriota bacterium]|nr:hypothetical protein [Acidobacteriota bacterium]